MDFITPVLIMVCVSALLGVVLILAEKYLADYGRCDIHINDDFVIPVEGGKKLNTLLADNKIYLPSSCAGKGTCGHCRVIVKNGGGDILPTEKDLLTRQDIRNNVRIACQVKVKTDIYISLPEESLRAKIFEAETAYIKDISPDLKEVGFRLIEPPEIDFTAGQYIQLKIPQTDEQRAYSIISLPDAKNRISLLIKLVEGGLCSTYIHDKLRAGDKIWFTGPHGSFCINDLSRDIIFVAGGCGIAPIRSIMLNLIGKKFSGEIKYFFGARTSENLYFYDEYMDLARKMKNFEFIPALSHQEKDDSWAGETGFIHETIEKYEFRTTDYLVYVCGPQAMIDLVTKVFRAKGFFAGDIFTDNI